MHGDETDQLVALAAAFERYDEALFTAYDEVTPFVLSEEEDEDDDEYDEDDLDDDLDDELDDVDDEDDEDDDDQDDEGPDGAPRSPAVDVTARDGVPAGVRGPRS
jgi:hypothetical protein